MEKNKTGKYFKYAIGEIILVVIGILIALQINNWNENRKSSEIRDNYYEQVLQDLEKDTAYINVIIKNLEINILNYQNYLEKLSKAESTDDILAILFELNWEFQYINFNTNTIESLISTGDIKLLPDHLRNKLLDLKTTQNAILKVTSGNDNNWLQNSQKAAGLGVTNLLLDINPKLLNQLNRKEDIISAINIINGTFQLKDFTEKNLLNSMKNLLDTIKELSELINAELNK
ncbi:DUF6090 family protein [Winogradskyella helgolandensis]|uniref:DUF6090 family protein n=1 Tax=Winogradskyella helgolandensis TaxID=2697010 RepID=UPI0015C0E6A1|nr:DUF6090 family protein [Winogradskyella helgolandensis]